MMEGHRVYALAFAKLYPLYRTKVEKKGRTLAELDEVITWLTGFDKAALEALCHDGTNLADFFGKAPRMNPARHAVTGVICGVRIEEIVDPLMREIRVLDKLVDELAKGRPMAKILRG
jgi:hypothetical protein